MTVVSRLKVYASDAVDAPLLLDLVFTGVDVRDDFVETRLRTALEGWRRGGLRELVKQADNTRRPRVTLVSDPSFLSRLAGDLLRKGKFRIEREELPGEVSFGTVDQPQAPRRVVASVARAGVYDGAGV